MVSRETLTASDFFDLQDVWFSEIFEQPGSLWDLLKKDWKEEWIRRKIRPNVSDLSRAGGTIIDKNVVKWEGKPINIHIGSYIVGNDIEIREGVEIESGAWVQGPTILGEGTVVRHGAYIRGGVITGKGAIIGHASEVKSSILLNHAKAPHFAYVGDSILGNHVNLGAGTKVSNLKIAGDEVILHINDKKIPSGLRKMGAIIGDFTETGCNSVLNPGVLLGKKCMVYPGLAVKKNYYADGSFIR